MQTSEATAGKTTGRSTTWNIDASHTNATFSVRHLMISNVRGEFQKVTGSVTYDPAKVTVNQMIAAIRTLGYKATLVTS